MKKILFGLMILFLLSFNVSALTCDTKEYDRLLELAKYVEITTVPKMSNNKVTYDITATNLNKDLKVLIIKNYYANDYKEFKYNKTKEATLTGFSDNQKVTVTVKGYVGNGCSGQTILTKVVNLPWYNTFSSSEECSEYPDFKYCTQFLNNKINKNTFDLEFNKYKGNIKVEEVAFNKVTKYNYLTLAIMGLILIVIMTMPSIVKYIDKRRKENSL